MSSPAALVHLLAEWLLWRPSRLARAGRALTSRKMLFARVSSARRGLCTLLCVMQANHRSSRGTRRAHGTHALALGAGIAVALSSLGAVRATQDRDDGTHAAARKAPPPAPASPARHTEATTRVRMRNVDFYVDPEVVLHIRYLVGTMRSKAGGPVVFDEKRSLVIRLEEAEVGLTAKNLSTLLNKFVFAYHGSPLSRLAVRMSGSQMVMTGHLHKVVDLPFEITASMDVTPEGLIRIASTKTKILGVNGAGIMKTFGLSLQKLVDLRGATGATVHGNDIFLDPTKILPPPTIEGHVTNVRADSDGIVLKFSAPATHEGPVALTPPDSKAANYMFYKGGTLHFGKLLMLDAEMQIVDLDPGDPFKFDLDRYQAQLVAGYSLSLSDGGLEVFMRDVDKVGRARATP